MSNVSIEYIYDKYKIKTSKLINKNYFLNTNISYKKYSNAILYLDINKKASLNTGVFDADNHFIAGTDMHTNLSQLNHCTPNLTDNILKINEKIIFIGSLYSCWGHCLTDNISRMWFLLSNEYKEQFSSLKIYYIPIKNFCFYENFNQLLSLLGIDSSIFIPLTEPTVFDEVIIPDRCFDFKADFGRYYTKEYCELINKIKNANKTNLDNQSEFLKLYLTRTSFNRGQTVGEKKIEDFYKKLGYKIVAPEKYSFYEQLSMINSCDELVTTEGSLSHNSLFMKSGAKLSILRRANYCTQYQLTINQISNIDIQYIDSHYSVFANKKCPWCGPYYYYINTNLYKANNISKKRRIVGFDFIKYIFLAVKIKVRDIKNKIKNFIKK